jgi:hypothetical protein
MKKKMKKENEKKGFNVVALIRFVPFISVYKRNVINVNEKKKVEEKIRAII